VDDGRSSKMAAIAGKDSENEMVSFLRYLGQGGVGALGKDRKSRWHAKIGRGVEEP